MESGTCSAARRLGVGWGGIAAPIAVAIAVAGCSGPKASAGSEAERPLLERYPVAARVACTEEMVEDGTTTRRESEETCSLSGDRVRCSYRYLEGDEPPGSGEERLDAEGYWSVGIDAIVWDPPVLVLPSDLAPGKRWVSETTMVLPGDPPQRTPMRRTNVVEASTRCDGGLVIRSERSAQLPGSSRTVTERLMCPGMSTPREARSWTYKSGAATPFRVITSSCRAE